MNQDFLDLLHSIGTVQIPFLGHDELIRNKRASGRPKDLVDLHLLEREQS